MRKLGLLGGTGPESTIFYYRAVIHGVQSRVGQRRLPPLSIESLSVFEVLNFCSRQDYDGLTDYLADGIERLSAAGAQVATLTGLTPHVVFDRLQERVSLPLISAVEATCDAAVQQGVKRVALLGTEYTMRMDFFTRPLQEAGIEVVIPGPGEVRYIQRKIVDELEYGIVTEPTRDALIAIIRGLRDSEGAERVILGCTELPLLLNDGNSPLSCLDSTAIHTRALVSAITSG